MKFIYLPNAVVTCAPRRGEIHLVDASSSTNVWVVVQNTDGVGTSGNRANSELIAYVWDGSVWNQLPTLTISGVSVLYGGSLRVWAANDAWLQVSTLGGHGAYIYHWDGSSWSLSFQTPGPLAGNGLMDGLSTSDMKYIARDSVGGTGMVLYHWDGSTWTTIVTSGLSNYTPGINDSTAIGGDTLTPAAPLTFVRSNGDFYFQATQGNIAPAQRIVRVTTAGVATRALAEVTTTAGHMYAMWMESDSVAYAVGSAFDFSLGMSVPRLYKGMSTTWAIQPVIPFYGALDPTIDDPGVAELGIGGGNEDDFLICGGYSLLSGVSYTTIDRRILGTWYHTEFGLGDPRAGDLRSIKYITSSDIWIVGEIGCASDTGHGIHTLIVHWDGSTWSVVNLPPP